MYKFRPSRPFHLVNEDDGRFNKDSNFLNGIVREQIEMGGVIAKVYRLKGTFEQTRDPLGIKTQPGIFDPIDFGSFMGVQDPILGENRDREYDFEEIVLLRGVYRVSQNDLEYAKFGLAGLTNDVMSMEFHIQSVEEGLGRRFIPGDVVEFTHLREVGIDGRVANRWYEVASVVKSPSGWDAMYAFHVLGVIMRPMRDAQEFLDLLERKDEYGKTLAEQIGNRENMLGITAANQTIAEGQAPTQWWDTTAIYIDPTNRKVISNWMVDDGVPPNGIKVASGQEFPDSPKENDYFVRTDFFPNRLYQYYSNRWRMKEKDDKREWQPYTWVTKIREYMSDRSETDKARKYELKSIHDVLTSRHQNSDPAPNNDD